MNNLGTASDNYFYSSMVADAKIMQEKLLNHDLMVRLQSNVISDELVKELAAMQVGYNFAFVSSLAQMRFNFNDSKKFIIDFLDPHLASEFGGDINAVDLKQDGTTHIKMIFDLTDSLSMTEKERMSWGEAVEEFFTKIIFGLIGNPNKGLALGALYADEIFANAWFTVFYSAMARYKEHMKKGIDLNFFQSHADEIEPAHQDHAVLLRGYCKEMCLEISDFNDGVDKFEKGLHNLFDNLNKI
jgi:hypothetical protein